MGSEWRDPAARVRTMEEFSAFVGLSRPTVSKFFNDPAALKDTTRRRIEAALATSGFQPNLLAANLVRRRSNLIGVIVPDTSDPAFIALADRVLALAQSAGFEAFVLSSEGEPCKEVRAVRTLVSMNVAGVLIAPLGEREAESDAALARLEAGIPLVYVDSAPADPAAFVGTDNRRSIGIIVDYLCRTGSPPCLLGLPPINSNAILRASAFEEAMRSRGLKPQVLALPRERDWDFERFGFEVMAHAIQSGEMEGKTVLCSNDRLAFGALAAAWQAGLKVGRGEDCHLRIAGHDDHPLSRYACPPLTTVAQDFEGIGRRAMQILLERIGGDPAEDHDTRTIFVEPHLRVRESA